MSRYRISIETGIDQATLSRFVNKHSDLSLPNIDKVSVCIGARLVLDAKAVKRAAAKRKGK